MRFWYIPVTLGIATLFIAPAVEASPQKPLAEYEAATSIAIGFDPPIGETLKFRTERTVFRDGKSQMNWAVSEYRFEESEGGYLLKVRLLDAGNREPDPKMAAFFKKVSQLSALPYSVSISDEAEIVGIENEKLYWDTVIAAFEAAVQQADVANPEVRQGLVAFQKMFREMPSESRLAMLTQDVQPLIEFAYTDLTLGEPVSAEIETESPFGGVITRQVRVTLRRLEGDMATVDVHMTVAPDELSALTKSLLEKMAPSEAAKVKDSLASLKLSHETRASYEITVSDGMLWRYISDETVEAADGEKVDRKTTSVTMQRGR